MKEVTTEDIIAAAKKLVKELKESNKTDMSKDYTLNEMKEVNYEYVSEHSEEFVPEYVDRVKEDYILHLINE